MSTTTDIVIDEIELRRAETNRDAILEEAAVCAERLSDAFANKDFNSVAGGAYAAAVAIRGMKRGAEKEPLADPNSVQSGKI